MPVRIWDLVFARVVLSYSSGMIRATFVFLCLLTFLLSSDAALAQSAAAESLTFDTSSSLAAGLVTCEGPDCTTCSVIEMVNLIIKLLIGVLVLVAVLLIVVSGVRLVVSGGDQSALTRAKETFTQVVIGFILILAAWLIVDTVLRLMMANGQGLEFWGKVECIGQTVPREVGVADAGNASSTLDAAQCQDDAALMKKYRGSLVGKEDPGLLTMIACYMNDPRVHAAVDGGQIYTVERTNPRCSLTNGDPVCGKCAHSNGSMHYGGGSGRGAMAVDFNAKGGISELDLYNRLKDRAAACGGKLLFENNHTHISL